MTWKSLNPHKFTAKEIDACRWIEECGIRGWLVDLKTKEVNALICNQMRKFASTVEFADYHGMNIELRKSQ